MGGWGRRTHLATEVVEDGGGDVVDVKGLVLPDDLVELEEEGRGVAVQGKEHVGDVVAEVEDEEDHHLGLKGLCVCVREEEEQRGRGTFAHLPTHPPTHLPST